MILYKIKKFLLIFLFCLMNIFFFNFNSLNSKNLPNCKQNNYEINQNYQNDNIDINLHNCYYEMNFTIDLNKIYKKKYKGYWINNLPNGKGEMVWSDNTIYRGDWKDGARFGYGVIYYPPNKKNLGDDYMVSYKGNWINDKKSGYGTIVYKNSKFTGLFYENIMNGNGLKKYKNGDVYYGGMLGDKYHGLGTKIYKDNSKYIGNWLNGKYEGYGTFFYKNGDVYEGFWQKGKRFGIGKIKYQNGKIISGIFSNGVFGNGIYKMTDVLYFYDFTYYWIKKFF